MERSRSHGLLKGVEFDYELMEEELTCPVCLELYADPLMLSCSHSVCKKCLQDIFDSKSDKGEPPADIHIDLECPSCRKPASLTRDTLTKLPRNLALENIVIRYTEERSKSIRKSLSLDSPVSEDVFSPLVDLADLPEFPSETATPCQLCERKSRSAASWFCHQCDVSYCHACLPRFHPSRGPLARHKVTQSKGSMEREGPTYCSEHEKEQISMYCDDCRAYACHLCVCDGVGKHAGHKMLVPDTASQRVRESVVETKSSSDMLVGRLCEQRSKLQTYMEEIKTLHNQSVARVEQHYCRLVADISTALAAEKSRVLRQLSTAHSQEVTRVKTCLHDNERASEALQRVSKECAELTQEKGAAKILSQASALQPLRVTLQEEGTQTECLTAQFETTVKNKVMRNRLQTGTQEFIEGSETVLRLFQDKECVPIVPVVQTPSSPGRPELSPRSPVQNKCLLTWGFSSSTFTGAALHTSATWTVTIEKNHGGTITTGCLFAVGVSSSVVGVKDVVGTTEGTHGLVCADGQVCLIAGGMRELLTALETLPLSLTLSVNTDHPHYTVLSYKLESAAGTDCPNLPLSGKKVLDDRRLKDALFPVFTVSQRVKLLFPTYV